MSVNKVILVGHLGKDPETRVFDNGEKVVNVSIATSESYTNKSSGEKVTNTEWTDLVIYGNNAEFVEKYLKKGANIYIEGKKVTRSYDDKEGNKRYVVEVILDKYKGVLLSLGNNQ